MPEVRSVLFLHPSLLGVKLDKWVGLFTCQSHVIFVLPPCQSCRWNERRWMEDTEECANMQLACWTKANTCICCPAQICLWPRSPLTFGPQKVAMKGMWPLGSTLFGKISPEFAADVFHLWIGPGAFCSNPLQCDCCDGSPQPCCSPGLGQRCAGARYGWRG